MALCVPTVAKSRTPSSCVLAGALPTHKHDSVNHAAKEYVRYEDGVCITTNTIEGYFSILKRGINGVYHHVGKQHLHRYLSEFHFRYNSRKEKDGDRTLLALNGSNGKRLNAPRLKAAKLGVQKEKFAIAKT